MKRHFFTLLLLLWSLLILPAQAQTQTPIYLSEFQLWAWPTEEGLKRLKSIHSVLGRSHHFMLFSRKHRHWNEKKTRNMIKEIASLKAFNLITIGDDHGAKKGHIMSKKGLNPEYNDMFLSTVAFIHQQGLLAGIEARNIPYSTKINVHKKWWKAIVDPALKERGVDIVKLSMEWLGGYQHHPQMVKRVEAAIKAIHEINPNTLVYLDSLGAEWREVRAAHRYLLQKFPEILINLHGANGFSGLNSSDSIQRMVKNFKKAGFKNIMVQINPNEGSQWFYYMARTLEALKDFNRSHTNFLSLAGGNLGYKRELMDILIQPIEPRLKLVKTVDELRIHIHPQYPRRKVSFREVFFEEFWGFEGLWQGPLHRFITGIN